MEEKAELLFKPGCKAGSEFCGECKSLDTSWPTCGCYPDEEIERNFDDESCEMFYKRCKSCLEAEAQLKELREKIERLVSLDDLKSIEQVIRNLKLVDINSADAYDMRDHIADRLELFIARREK